MATNPVARPVDEGKKPTSKHVKKAAKKSATKKKATTGLVPRQRAFADDAVIKLLVKTNPFRPPLAGRFQHILDGKAKTVADYSKLTNRYPDLRFYVQKDAISIPAAK